MTAVPTEVVLQFRVVLADHRGLVAGVLGVLMRNEDQGQTTVTA